MKKLALVLLLFGLATGLVGCPWWHHHDDHHGGHHGHYYDHHR